MSRFLKHVLVALVFWFLLAPALTFIHEIGHSVLPLIAGENVTVTVGGYTGSPWSFGNLSLVYAGPWLPWVGYTDWSGETAFWRLALGPITSLILLAIAVALLRQSRRWETSLLLRGAIGWTVGAFIFTGYPLDYPRFLVKNPTAMSDGRQIVNILQSQSH